MTKIEKTPKELPSHIDPSKVKKKLIEERHSDEIVYLIEREFYYDPQKKNTVIHRSTNLGRIDPKTGKLVPSRSKRKNGEGPAPRKKKVQAKITRTGAMDILEKVGQHSKIDLKVLDSYDSETALKLLSYARYMVMTDQPVYEIDDFAFAHNLPYSSGISADICDHLVEELGRDVTGGQNLFHNLANYVSDSPLFAFVSTIKSLNPNNTQSSGWGFEDPDALNSFKLITLYSLEKRIPIMIDFMRGNIPDIKILSNTIHKTKGYGLAQPIFVLDSISHYDIYKMSTHQIEFIGDATSRANWAFDPLKEKYGSYASLVQALDEQSACTVYDGINAITTEQLVDSTIITEFYGEVLEPFKVYLTYCKDKKVAQDKEEALYQSLNQIITSLKSEYLTYEELNKSTKDLAKQYLHITYDENGKINIEYNVEALKETLQYAGVFSIVSSFKVTEEQAIKLYHSRNKIEESYRTNKSFMIEDNLHFSNTNKILGNEICRMIALGYHSYLQAAINNVIKQCEQKVSDKNLSEMAKVKYDKLKNWLKNKPLRSVLRWFDGIEHLDINSEFGEKRLSTEYTQRDQLFLDMLFEELESPSYSQELKVDNLP